MEQSKLPFKCSLAVNVIFGIGSVVYLANTHFYEQVNTRSKRDVDSTRQSQSYNQEEFFNSLRAGTSKDRDQKQYFATFERTETGTRQKARNQAARSPEASSSYTNQISLANDAIAILNNQYQFNNLATKDETRRVEKLMERMEQKLMVKLNAVSNSVTAESNKMDIAIKQANDGVSKMAEKVDHITQNTRQVQDNLSAKIDTELIRLRDNIKDKVTREIRNVFDLGWGKVKKNFEKKIF